MIDIMDIPDDELNRYVKRLIPTLTRRKPYEWVPIASIANNPARFYDVVVCLNSYGYFKNNLGWSMIEVSNDEKFVRIIPDNLIMMNRDDRYRWKYENLWK